MLSYIVMYNYLLYLYWKRQLTNRHGDEVAITVSHLTWHKEIYFVI